MKALINDLTAFGETKSIKGWISDSRAALKLTARLLRCRLRLGMNPEKAITTRIHFKKYKYNHDYFQNWTHENAYIIGFLTADGSISKKRNLLSVDLSQKDTCVLEHIRDKISPEYKLSLFNKSCGNNKTNSPVVRLQVYSQQIVQDLAKYNVVPQKTGKEKLPNFPNKKIAYRYLLGLIDGDGYIFFGKNTKGYKRVLINLASANKKFLTEITGYFGLDTHIYRYANSNCYQMHIGGRKQLINFYHNLYDSGGFCLQRKKDKFIEIVNSYIS